MSYPKLDEHDILATRSIAIVLIVMTVLLCFCWIVFKAPLFQAAAFVSGLIAIVTWLSYCQQQTVASIEQLGERQKR